MSEFYGAKSRVLVTGAQGFIGRYLTAAWLDADPDAVLLGIGRSRALADVFTHELEWNGSALRAPLPPQLARRLRDPRSLYEQLDVRDRHALTSLLQRFAPTHVVQLATVRDAPTAAVSIESSVALIEVLFEAIAGAGIPAPRVCMGSTGGVYGGLSPGASPVAESAPGAPVDLYAVGLRAGEDVARLLAERHGIPLVIARIFNVAGPGQHERHVCGRLASQVAAVRKGLRAPLIEVGALDTHRDFLDVRDVASGLRTIAEQGVAGLLYNVAGGREVSVHAVLRRLADLAGLAAALEVRTLPPRGADPRHHVADVARLRALSWQPRSGLGECLEDMLRYYADTVAPIADRRATAAVDEPVVAASPLHVSVSATHRYTVHIEAGLLERLPQLLQNRYPRTRMAVLTDERVDGLYGRRLVAGMQAIGIHCDAIVLPEGERSKSLAAWSRAIESLHALGFDRRSLLVNLGGGLATDVGGFVAASYMRGVEYVNVPTTLLAQHDSAIGGKVAVNAAWAKNFIGAFHHPSAVYCDPSTLATLSDRDVSAGVAEAIKVALVAEPDLFELLERRSDAIRNERRADLLGEVVARAAATKIALLDPDPYEVDLRRALNLGHTFGHPLETELEYEGLLHGEAVGFGIAVATAIARARGVCDAADAERIYALLDLYGLPPRVLHVRLIAACRRLAAIRLVRANQLHFVLPARIGRVEIVPEVADSEFAAAIDAIGAHPTIGHCVVP